MEKLHKPIVEKLAPVKLFYEDILEIYNILNEDNKNNIAIEADVYKIESIEEILQIEKTSFRNLCMHKSEPYISLRITQKWISLDTYSHSALARGYCENIKSSLNSKRSLFQSLINSNIAMFFYFITSIVWFKLDEPKIFIFVFVSAICWGIYSDLFGGSILVPKHKKSSPNFFKRNKDQIILAIISALFGVVGSYLVSELLK